MKKVTFADVRSLHDYELARDELRPKILATKALRRVAVGDHLTVLFENHDTVLYQIQEMLRAERITHPDAIHHEIDTYNELVGDKDELRATLLIEYSDPAERDARLRDLVGIEKHVRLEVDGAGSCAAEFDMRQIDEKRVSSVHYVRFPLGAKLAAAVRRGVPIEIVIDHPKMKARGRSTAQQTAALAADLSD